MNGPMIKIVWLLLLFILSTPIEVVTGNPAHPSTPHLSARQKAEFLLSRKQYEEASRAYKSLLKAENADSTLFRGLVKAYQGAGRLN